VLKSFLMKRLSRQIEYLSAMPFVGVD